MSRLVGDDSTSSSRAALRVLTMACNFFAIRPKRTTWRPLRALMTGGGIRAAELQEEPAFMESTPTLELPAEFWREVQDRFEARPGQLNTWTIPLPDELIQAVRAHCSRLT